MQLTTKKVIRIAKRQQPLPQYSPAVLPASVLTQTRSTDGASSSLGQPRCSNTGERGVVEVRHIASNVVTSLAPQQVRFQAGSGILPQNIVKRVRVEVSDQLKDIVKVSSAKEAQNQIPTIILLDDDCEDIQLQTSEGKVNEREHHSILVRSPEQVRPPIVKKLIVTKQQHLAAVSSGIKCSFTLNQINDRGSIGGGVISREPETTRQVIFTASETKNDHQVRVESAVKEDESNKVDDQPKVQMILEDRKDFGRKIEDECGQDKVLMNCDRRDNFEGKETMNDETELKYNLQVSSASLEECFEVPLPAAAQSGEEEPNKEVQESKCLPPVPLHVELIDYQKDQYFVEWLEDDRQMLNSHSSSISSLTTTCRYRCNKGMEKIGGQAYVSFLERQFQEYRRMLQESKTQQLQLEEVKEGRVLTDKEVNCRDRRDSQDEISSPRLVKKIFVEKEKDILVIEVKKCASIEQISLVEQEGKHYVSEVKEKGNFISGEKAVEGEISVGGGEIVVSSEEAEVELEQGMEGEISSCDEKNIMIQKNHYISNEADIVLEVPRQQLINVVTVIAKEGDEIKKEIREPQEMASQQVVAEMEGESSKTEQNSEQSIQQLRNGGQEVEADEEKISEELEIKQRPEGKQYYLLTDEQQQQQQQKNQDQIAEVEVNLEPKESQVEVDQGKKGVLLEIKLSGSSSDDEVSKHACESEEREEKEVQEGEIQQLSAIQGLEQEQEIEQQELQQPQVQLEVIALPEEQQGEEGEEREKSIQQQQVEAQREEYQLPLQEPLKAVTEVTAENTKEKMVEGEEELAIDDFSCGGSGVLALISSSSQNLEFASQEQVKSTLLEEEQIEEEMRKEEEIMMMEVERMMMEEEEEEEESNLEEYCQQPSLSHFNSEQILEEVCDESSKNQMDLLLTSPVIIKVKAIPNRTTLEQNISSDSIQQRAQSLLTRKLSFTVSVAARKSLSGVKSQLFRADENNIFTTQRNGLDKCLNDDEGNGEIEDNPNEVQSLSEPEKQRFKARTSGEVEDVKAIKLASQLTLSKFETPTPHSL